MVFFGLRVIQRFGIHLYYRFHPYSRYSPYISPAEPGKISLLSSLSIFDQHELVPVGFKNCIIKFYEVTIISRLESSAELFVET